MGLFSGRWAELLTLEVVMSDCHPLHIKRRIPSCSPGVKHKASSASLSVELAEPALSRWLAYLPSAVLAVIHLTVGRPADGCIAFLRTRQIVPQIRARSVFGWNTLSLRDYLRLTQSRNIMEPTYISPSIEANTLTPEGVLCQSMTEDLDNSYGEW